MLGSHLSIAGGLHLALLEARRLGMDCLQIFTANQRQWDPKPLSDEAVQLWHEHRRTTGLDAVVAHDCYLVNLAGPPGAIRRRSIERFRDELLRCESLSIPLLVAHPGCHMDPGNPSAEGRGLRRVAEALDELHRDLPGLRVVTCLEVTAGQGTSVGWRLEHLRDIIAAAAEPERLAVCLDTAHLLAAGYDLTTARGTEGVLQEVESVLGLARVRAWHLNDSKVPRASRVDRHEHIGHGYIPLTAFRVIVNHPAFRNVPKLLETPKETAPDGRLWDEINLATLRRLVRRENRRRA